MLLALLSLVFLGAALSMGPGGARLLPFVVLLWAAVASQLVAAAYLVGESGVFGKRQDGRLPPLRVLAFLPYFVLAWAIRDLVPLVTREPAWTEVAAGLWLGRYVRNHAALPDGVECVVDLTAESPAIGGLPDSVEYICVPTLDGSAPPPGLFETLVGRLAQSSQRLYVHCAAGHGRSALVAAALLVARREARGPDDAVARLSRVRPRISLNIDQRRALDELSGRLARVPDG
jgi:hypothetical protein